MYLLLSFIDGRYRDEWFGGFDMTRHRRRVIVVGVAFVVASLVASYSMSLLHAGPPETRHPSEPRVLVRATLVPFLFLAYGCVVTVPATMVASVLVAVSLAKERLWWLSIAAFSLMGLLWVVAAWFASVVPLD